MQATLTRRLFLETRVNAIVRRMTSEMLAVPRKPVRMINDRQCLSNSDRWERDRFTGQLLSSWNR